MPLYYPQSQIKTNLYTGGGEYMLEFSKKEYIGYYYKLSNGKKYVGKTPQNSTQLLLIPLIEEIENPETLPTNPPIIYKPNNDFGESYLSLNGMVNNEDYRKLTGIGANRFPPTPYYSTPTGEDFEIGEYRRYFAKKTNEYIYIEISKETYTKFKSNDPTVASDLYNCLFLPWNIDGNPEVNIKIVSQIERNNKWYGFTSYFQGNFG